MVIIKHSFPVMVAHTTRQSQDKRNKPTIFGSLISKWFLCLNDKKICLGLITWLTCMYYMYICYVNGCIFIYFYRRWIFWATKFILCTYIYIPYINTIYCYISEHSFVSFWNILCKVQNLIQENFMSWRLFNVCFRSNCYRFYILQLLIHIYYM